MKQKPYDPKKIEKKWQQAWAKKGLYKATEEKGKKKCYVLDMFPYPSGDGLHVGHPKGYIATDVYSRMKRMAGHSVLHPMGWDAFGLPAENYAIKNKVHPEKAVQKNIKRFKEQLSRIGFNYDWTREVNTTDPGYYKWTQWIFLQLFNAGLAKESYEPINWCPSCQTGLANEDLEDGRCERCGSVVEKKPIRQWVLAITKYADRLLKDLDALAWPESIKQSQREWIGRSEGAEISFKIQGHPHSITVFTTRPDTLFGATYVVLAPEHPLLAHIKDHISNWSEVEGYIRTAGTLSEMERTSESKEKTGVPLKGLFAVNPATEEEIPIWVADYVLGNYGTGAIMAVPAHDTRDHAFAKAHNLPVRVVVEPITGTPAKDEEYRMSIVAVVRNPKTGKILSLNWGALGGNLFVGGGLENGEDPAECAKREVLEETGYANVRLLSQTETVHHHYRAHSKNVNRKIDAVGFLFELEDETQKKTAHTPEEKGKFIPEWLTPEEAKARVTDPLHSYVFRKLVAGEIYTGEGISVNSGAFSGMPTASAGWSIVKAVGGKTETKYKLRDWVFARQRYWGEPFPLVHCEACSVRIRTKKYKKGEFSKGELLNPGWVTVPERQLPVELPKVKSYEPTGTGESPLASITKWVNVKCPKCKSPARRETNTMPQWAGSSWYYLRFADAKNKKALVDKKKEKYWLPVDVYVGGTEHATRHLIYARFWHKFLFDIGVVHTKEPFTRLESLGVVLAEDGRKMSKRWGNVINPDDIIDAYGADTMRLYEMFMGPFENAIAWNTQSMIGVRRFLDRVWRMQYKVAPQKAKISVQDPAVESLLHKTIEKVGNDIEAFKFNTAISSLMILSNELEKMPLIPHAWYSAVVLLLAPFAPHASEELWAVVGGKGSVHLAPWPAFDKKKMATESVRIVVQINGKVRDTFEADAAWNEAEIVAKVKAREQVSKWLEGKQVLRTIYVPKRLVNFVIAG